MMKSCSLETCCTKGKESEAVKYKCLSSNDPYIVVTFYSNQQELFLVTLSQRYSLVSHLISNITFIAKMKDCNYDDNADSIFNCGDF